MNQIQRWTFVGCLLFLPASTISGQGIEHGATRFDRQIRATAALEARPVGPTPIRTIRPDVRHANAPIVGAVVGAVALPAMGYLIFHDRDSGSVNGGGLLLIAAVAAVLGYIVGLAIRGG
jgi:hypothetical protein